jgi:hypothetical protein
VLTGGCAAPDHQAAKAADAINALAEPVSRIGAVISPR